MKITLSEEQVALLKWFLKLRMDQLKSWQSDPVAQKHLKETKSIIEAIENAEQ